MIRTRRAANHRGSQDARMLNSFLIRKSAGYRLSVFMSMTNR